MGYLAIFLIHLAFLEVPTCRPTQTWSPVIPPSNLKQIHIVHGQSTICPTKDIEKAFIAILVGCYCSIFLLGLLWNFSHTNSPCGSAPAESPQDLRVHLVVASPADGPPMMPGLLLVGGLEHVWILTFHILGILIATDEHMFQRGSNHQPGSFIRFYQTLLQSNWA